MWYYLKLSIRALAGKVKQKGRTKRFVLCFYSALESMSLILFSWLIFDAPGS